MNVGRIGRPGASNKKVTGWDKITVTFNDGTYNRIVGISNIYVIECPNTYNNWQSGDLAPGDIFVNHKITKQSAYIDFGFQRVGTEIKLNAFNQGNTSEKESAINDGCNTFQEFINTDLITLAGITDYNFKFDIWPVIEQDGVSGTCGGFTQKAIGEVFIRNHVPYKINDGIFGLESVNIEKM